MKQISGALFHKVGLNSIQSVGGCPCLDNRWSVVVIWLYHGFLNPLKMGEGKMKKNSSTITYLIYVAIFILFGFIYYYMIFRHSRSKCYTGCQCNLKNIGTALEMYSIDNNGYYPTGLHQLKPNYLRKIPTCPDSERTLDIGWFIFSYDIILEPAKDTYSKTYVSSTNPKAYTVYCGGHHHANVGLPANYPQYNSRKGLTARP